MTTANPRTDWLVHELRAQQIAQGDPMVTASPRTDRLVHELRAQQIELEAQNEELRRTQSALDASLARYVDLYDLAPVGYCTLSESGQILEANLTAASLFGVARGALVNQPISRYLSQPDADRHDLLRKQLLATGLPQVCEVRLLRASGEPLWIRLDSSLARQSPDAVPLLRTVLVDISQTKQHEQALLETAASLEAKVQLRTQQARSAWNQMTRIEQHERKLLAQELHDDLGQLLVLIKIKLDTLDGTALRAGIQDIGRLVDQAMRAVRMVSLQLSPPILGTLGLVPALEWLTEEMQHNFGMQVQLDITGCKQPLDSGVQSLLFRAARELLINVIRHAGVKSADLVCCCQDGQLRLVVSDRGCGFDPNTCMSDVSGRHNFGLQSVHERITNMGGTMDIISSPGHGATITLHLPRAVAIQEEPDDPNFAGR